MKPLFEIREKAGLGVAEVFDVVLTAERAELANPRGIHAFSSQGGEAKDSNARGM